MDDDQIMQQETQNEGSDSFLDGWDDGPEREETAPAGEAETGAGDQAEAPAGDGGEIPDGGPGGSGGDTQPGGAPDAPGQDGPEAGGKEPPPEGPGKDAPPPEEKDAPAPRTWTLNHQGQPVTISEADVPALAQKGLDYDRLRASYDEARPVMDLFRGFAERSGKTVPEFVAQLRIQAKQAAGISEAEARQAVELEDREARIAAKEEYDRRQQEEARQAQAFQQQRQARVQADIQEFIRVFPDAARDFQNIPKEVWDAVNGGMSLVAAYAYYNNAQANAREQAEEAERARREAVQRQNQKNAANSAGSMKSAGSSHGPKDPFAEGFDED